MCVYVCVCVCVCVCVYGWLPPTDTTRMSWDWRRSRKKRSCSNKLAHERWRSMVASTAALMHLP